MIKLLVCIFTLGGFLPHLIGGAFYLSRLTPVDRDEGGATTSPAAGAVKPRPGPPDVRPTTVTHQENDPPSQDRGDDIRAGLASTRLDSLAVRVQFARYPGAAKRLMTCMSSASMRATATYP